MKTTMVPAQVTTVEDKIAGSLSLSQLLLLCAPVFIDCGIYVVFPPFLKLTLLKAFVSFLIILGFGALAIRIKGKIVALWLVVILRYRLRPRYYIFNKNEAYLRDPLFQAPVQTEVAKSKHKLAKPKALLPKLAIPEMVRLETVIADPRAKLKFRADRKRGLRVFITEVK